MISVAICSYNPREDYFAECLKGLRRQSLSPKDWQLLVVDNRSDKPVEGLVLTWHPNATVVREERSGLTHARLRAIRETQGEIIIFVDDDNVLDPDFLEKAAAVAEDMPFLGSWSGQCRPMFETEPPSWTRRYWGNLVIREFSQNRWSNLPRLAQTMPCGAGLCVRREVAEHYIKLHETGRRSTLLDRTAGSLLSGGDNDLAACACEIGLGTGLISSLKLTHLIPAEKLTVDYLVRLAEGIQFSSTFLDFEWGLASPRRGFLGWCADTVQLLRVGGPHRKIQRAVRRGRVAAAALIRERIPGEATQHNCQW